MSQYVTIVSIERLEAHVKEYPECGPKGKMVGTGRSIWTPGFMGGSGEVRQVCEAYCPDHHLEPRLPKYGTPIYEDQITLV